MLKGNCFCLCFKKKQNRPKKKKDNKSNITKFHTLSENEIKCPFTLVDLGKVSKLNSTRFNSQNNDYGFPDSDMSITVYKNKAIFQDKEHLADKEGVISVKLGFNQVDENEIVLVLKLSKADFSFPQLMFIKDQKVQPMIKIRDKFKLRANGVFIAAFYKFEISTLLSSIVIKVIDMKTKTKEEYFFEDEKEEIKIGRDNENDIIINSRMISKNHIKISKVGFSWFVKEEEDVKHSKNGLWYLIEDKYPLMKETEFIMNGRGFVVKEGDLSKVLKQRKSSDAEVKF